MGQPRAVDEARRAARRPHRAGPRRPDGPLHGARGCRWELVLHLRIRTPRRGHVHRGEGLGGRQRREPDGVRSHRAVVPRGDHPLHLRAHQLLSHRRGVDGQPRIRHRGQVHRPPHAAIYEIGHDTHQDQGGSLAPDRPAGGDDRRRDSLRAPGPRGRAALDRRRDGRVRYVRRDLGRGTLHHPQIRGLQAQADLLDRPLARRPHQGGALRAARQARGEHRRGAHGVGRYQRPRDRPPEAGRAVPQAVSGQRGPRAEDPHLQHPGLHLHAARRRPGGRAHQPQVSGARREEHRPPDQHRQRPRHDLEAREQHEPPRHGALRHRGSGQGDRRAGRDRGRPQGYRPFGQGGRESSLAFLGAGRQTLHRPGVRQSGHQLDPLRPRGGHDAHPLPRHARSYPG